MTTNLKYGTRRSVWVLVGGLALATLILLPLRSSGRTLTDDDDDDRVVRVEEDWSLLVTQPVFNLSCPQVSTEMAPRPSSSQFYQFHLNSQDVPHFVQGGLQLQAWNNQTVLAVKTSSNLNTMATANELVTWTQYLKRTDDNGLLFGVSAANSTTWGDFSGAEFKVSGADANLDHYSVDYSVQNSGITYGSNLVFSLVLLRTRTYYADGSVQTDNLPRIIYSAP